MRTFENLTCELLLYPFVDWQPLERSQDLSDSVISSTLDDDSNSLILSLVCNNLMVLACNPNKRDLTCNAMVFWASAVNAAKDPLS